MRTLDPRLEIAPAVDGDRGWVGVNTRLDPGQLDAGYVADALNRRFDRRTIRNRWSIVRPQWGGISGQQAGSIQIVAGDKSAGIGLPKTPMRLASVAAEGLQPGTLITEYKAANVVTLDRDDIFLDDTTITIDSEPEVTLSRAPLRTSTTTLAYVADNSVPWSGRILGSGGFLDPDSGARVVLVAVDEPRATDGGQGRIWAVQPGYPPQEVPLNGHDLNGTVRLIQGFNGVLLLRSGAGRWYVRGDEIESDKLVLHVAPSFPNGTRVRWNQVLTASPIGSLLSGTDYWAHVAGPEVSLHRSRSDAITGTNPIPLTATTAAERYYLERHDPYDVLDNPARNNGTPLLMQATESQREAIMAGFDRVPDQLAVIAADPDVDVLTASNHRLISGDAVVIAGSTIGGVANGTYYAHVTDPNGFRLFQVQLEAVAGQGASLVDITAEGTATVRKSSSETAPIPPARDGVYFANRVWLVYGTDLLLASGIMDLLHYRRLADEFRINSGTDDAIVAVAPFNQDSLIIFKERSILALTEVYGDLSQMRLVEITREFGCLAALSVAATGTDLVFLSQRGVATIRQTAEGLSQSVVEPLSEPVESYIDQIAWRNVAEACGTYFGNRYLLAVPSEAQPHAGNSMTLVYNFSNRAWEGVWTGSMLLPDAWFTVVVSGRPTLAWLDRGRWIHYFEPTGLADQAMDGTQIPIATRILSRGYNAALMEHKRWTRADIELATWNPDYSIAGQFDGVGERIAMIAGQSHDRTRYLTVDGGVYDPTNRLDNFAQPFRADYSLVPGFRCRSGVRTNQHQRYLHKLRIGRRSGATLQLELSTACGSVEVLSLMVEAIPHRSAGYTQH